MTMHRVCAAPIVQGVLEDAGRIYPALRFAEPNFYDVSDPNWHLERHTEPKTRRGERY